MNTPDKIIELLDNQIFVFGSNTQGVHGSGAARQAFKQFGAQWHVGEGLTGQCYAFPTLDADSSKGVWLVKRSHEALKLSADRFIAIAENYPDIVFLLTRVGCGLAGYEEDYMKSFFKQIPSNVIKPKGW